jgi:LysM repeat protein
VKGDTLWDLSGKYYQDEWSWGKIYEANREIISDPNMIYPDQVITIPDKNYVPAKRAEQEVSVKEPEEQPLVKEEAESPAEPALPEEISEPAEVLKEEVAEPEPAVEEAPAAVPVPVEVAEEEIAPRVINVSTEEERRFTLPVNFEFDGKITGEKNNKQLISQTDTVYINAGKNKDLKAKMRGDVIRIIGRTKGPKRESLYQVKKTGIIELTSDIREDNSVAIVIRSYEPIEKGDLIRIKTGE